MKPTVGARFALYAAGRREVTVGDSRIVAPVLAVVVCVAASAFLLGTWGWSLADGTLDHPTVLYRTTVLFVFDDGGVRNAPWPLDVARFLAPIATLVAVLNWAVTGSAFQLQAWASRRSTGHVVLVGPPELVWPYARSHPDKAPGSIVHACRDGNDRMTGVLNAPVDWLVDRSSGRRSVGGTSESWISRCGALHADAVVIATGDDEESLGLLGSLVTELNEAKPPPSLRVIVELVDPELVPWMSLSLAHSATHVDVDFVCRTEASARHATAEVLNAMEEAERCAASSRTGLAGISLQIALIGDGSLAQLVGTSLLLDLTEWHRTHADHPHPVLHVLADEGLAAVKLGEHSRVDLVRHRDPDGLMSVAGALTAALVLYDEPSDWLRAGVRLRHRNRSLLVVVPAKRKELAGGLTPLAADVIESALELEGPFNLIARERHRRVLSRRRTSRASSPERSGNDQPEVLDWDSLDAELQREHVRAVRHVIDALNERPEVDLLAGAPAKMIEPLKRDVAEDLKALPGVFPPDWPDCSWTELAGCPYWLRAGGLYAIAGSRRGPVDIGG